MDIYQTKLLTAVFAAALLAGCASTDISDDTAVAIAAEQAAADTAAEEEAARKTAEVAASLQSIFYFDFDQATLSAETRAALDAQIAVLKNSNAKVRLEGHADERGTREYNMALGERRLTQLPIIWLSTEWLAIVLKLSAMVKSARWYLVQMIQSGAKIAALNLNSFQCLKTI